MGEAKTGLGAEAASLDSAGRLLAIDLGTKRVGVAVSDELRITIRPLPAIARRSWKDLLRQIVTLVEEFQAKGLVVGLPLRLDGGEGEAAANARSVASKFQRSLGIPVLLQDERLTSLEAESDLRSAGKTRPEIKGEIDSAAAVVILRDYIAGHDRSS